MVASVEGAIERLREHRFDALLVDHDLDDGKGDRAVARAREMGYEGTIVAVSARDDGNQALVAAGADAVCGKMEFKRIRSVLGV